MTHCIGAALVCVSLAAAAQGAAQQQAIGLRIEDGSWRKVAFADGAGAPGEAAVFAIEHDTAEGLCLAVGPWTEGKWSARFQHAELLPHRTGTLSGLYRTEGLGDGDAAAFVEFYRGKERLMLRTFPLDASADWAPFSVAARHAPAGTDGASPGFGLRRKTAGRVLFAGLSFSPELPPLEFPEALPKALRRAPKATFPAAGFYRLAEADGTWWLAAPDGRAFYSLGVDGPTFARDEAGLEQGLGCAALMDRAGFNSLGGWTNIWRWRTVNETRLAEGRPAFAAFMSMQSGSSRARFDHLVDAQGRTTGEGHAFPDPFDPRFEEAYRESVRNVAEGVRGKPWFAGWFADNEVSHTGLYRHVYSRHCSLAFRDWLAAEYGGVGALNAAWQADFASLEDLVARRLDPHPDQSQLYEDFLRFERQIVKRYVEVTLSVIRSEDPDHLVFSNRFMMGDSEDWRRVLDLYAAYDGAAVNIYPANTQAGLTERERAILRLVHERTGRPVIIGEWSVPALDSGLYEDAAHLDWSWDEAVETQQQRARQAARLTVEFSNMPFVVGSHWFTWRDFDSPTRRANRGLVRADGTPCEELLDGLARANAAVAESVAAQSGPHE